MTIAAGFRCKDGIVLCSDTQETIPDYLKLHGQKISIFQHLDDFRIGLTGAGGADMIDMVFRLIIRQVTGKKRNIGAIQDIIADVVYETVMKHVMPFPRDERPWFQLLIAIQAKGERAVLLKAIDTTIRPVDDFACVGGVAFAHYAVRGIDVRKLPLCVARSLAIYMLMLVKEYDPNCGKRSDVLCLYDDWTLEEPSQQYVETVAYQLGIIQNCAGQIMLNSMAHRGTGEGLQDTWQHMKKHIHDLQKVERERMDEGCRLKADWLRQYETIHLKVDKSDLELGPQELEPEK